MDRIEQTYLIDASPDEVWRALTDPGVIQVWSGAPAAFSPEAGVDYSLWGGDIAGQVVEVVPQERLVQTWKPNNWQVEDSTVTFLLTPSDGGTRVDLIHERVQDWDYDPTSEGWNIYYLGAIKKMLEANAPKAAPAKRRAPAKKAAAKKGKAAPRSAKKSAAKKGKRSAKKSAGKKKTSSRKR